MLTRVTVRLAESTLAEVAKLRWSPHPPWMMNSEGPVPSVTEEIPPPGAAGCDACLGRGAGTGAETHPARTTAMTAESGRLMPPPLAWQWTETQPPAQAESSGG